MRGCFALLLLLLAGVSGAQVEQGTITGSVTDASGAVVPNARVTITNVATGVARETQSAADGHYTAPYLPPGQYEVAVAAQGFDKARVRGVNITVGLTATIDVILKPGSLQQEVTVTAAVVQLEAQTFALGNVVGSRQILELPLLGRNPYSLVTLAPGVIDRGNSGTGPIINGGRSNTSEVLLDGAETRNTTTNDLAYSPPLETVQEFKVITNGMSAEFGRSGGGVLTAATRSGTNKLHGSVYEFLRNNALNANSWSNNRSALKKSPFRRNEYGASAGGPVYVPKFYDGRNRTFFFINWEQTKDRSPDDTIQTVPTLLERRGDFSQTVDGSGNLIRVYDPLTTRPNPSAAGRYLRDPFDNNRIPTARLDPIALKILEYYPEPNRTSRTNNFALNGSRQNDSWRTFFRIDQSVGTRHQLFFTYGRQDNPRYTPGFNIAFPSEGVNGEKGKIESHPRTAVLSDTVTFKPNLIGEFRASVTRGRTITAPRSVGFDFTQLGIGPEVKARAAALLFPRIEPADVTTLGPDRASYFNDVEQSNEMQGHISWLRGAHSLKAGYDYTFLAFNVNRAERPAGIYSFSRAFTQGPDPSVAGNTGFGVATLLLGAPTGGSISADPVLAASQKFQAWYIQDDWKLRRDLTLNVGLRWEYQTPWSDRFNQLGYFDPAATDPITGMKGVMRFVGRDGNPRYQSDPDKNNFAPRVGLAWQARKNTVVRLGYGMFYFPGSGGIGSGASDLGDGFLVQTQVYLGTPMAAPNTPPPGASLAHPFLAGFDKPPSTLQGSGTTTAFRDWVTPLNQQWNLNIQRSLGTVLIEVAYVGSRGQRIWINRNHNADSTQYLSLGTALDEALPNPWYSLAGAPSALSAPRTRTRSQLLMPFPHYFGSVTRFRDAVGDSVYHGMTVRLDKRFGHGLTVQGSYTASKLIDNVPERFSGRSTFIDPNNLAISRSVSSEDRSQVFVANYIYDLPVGQGRHWLKQGVMGRVIGNWQIGGITRFATGLPVFITGPSNTRLQGVSAYAMRVKSPVLPSSQKSLERWFDTTAFQAAPQFSLGNDSRTEPNLRNPGAKLFDLSLSRSQQIGERARLQFRAEFFNAFNTTQLAGPQGSLTAADFGKITSAGSPRNIQFGLRLSF